MAKNPQHIYLVRSAHMYRKLETGKRHISAPCVSLENGTYLPPIYRTIDLRVKRRREKELNAYASYCQSPYGDWKARAFAFAMARRPPSCFPRHLLWWSARREAHRGSPARHDEGMLALGDEGRRREGLPPAPPPGHAARPVLPDRRGRLRPNDLHARADEALREFEAEMAAISGTKRVPYGGDRVFQRKIGTGAASGTASRQVRDPRGAF